MAGLRFEWEPRKAALNIRKHGVSFEEAQTAFLDDDGLLLADPEHSDDEERFILLGATVEAKLVVVCHCYRTKDDVIRIISARLASKQERATYRARGSQ